MAVTTQGVNPRNGVGWGEGGNRKSKLKEGVPVVRKGGVTSKARRRWEIPLGKHINWRRGLPVGNPRKG
jgi:hypothetical protein